MRRGVGDEREGGGLADEINWFAALMSVAAFIALYRFKADVLWVVIAGGFIGLGRMLLFG